MADFGKPDYGITRTLDGVTYSDAIPAVTEALKKQGFGVLTEIDVKATLKKKIDVDFQPYIILGACSPTHAHMALTGEPGVGLLMPCNVVVTQDDAGNAVVSAVEPKALFGLLDSPDIGPVAQEVHDKLKAAVDSL